MQSVTVGRNANSYIYFHIYCLCSIKLCCYKQPEKNLNFVDVFVGEVLNLN